MSTISKTELYPLPKQYTARPVTLDDAEAIVELGAIVSRAKGIDYKATVEVQRADWQEPKFNLADSAILIEDGDEVVGYAIIWDNAATPVRPWCPWMLKHELYGSGVDRFLLNWLEEKAYRVIEKCPPDAKIVMQTNAFEGYQARVNVLKDAGFTHARNFYRMLIEMNDAPPKAQLPDNIVMRGLNYPDEIEKMAAAAELSFKDHWGLIEEPLEEAVKFWRHFTASSKLFDPELYFLAIDSETDEIAGIALCHIEQVGKPETAYIEELAVMPQYRRQGLALGMLHHAFGELYQRGRRQVALHVDADNLKGATRLYTKAGMKPDETWMNYQKVLRDGIELATTSV